MIKNRIWAYLFPFDDMPEYDASDSNFAHAQANAIFKHLPLILLADIAAGSYLFAVMSFAIEGPLLTICYHVLMLDAATRW